MATQKKIDTVKTLTAKLLKAKAMVVADYQGLSHKQIEDLRKVFKKTQAEFSITKNTLLKRALTEAKKVVNDQVLTGPTATLFAYADEVSPIKELLQFLKAAGIGKIKAGLLGDKEMSVADVDKLASLSSRSVLIEQLLGQLQAPLFGLHNALSWNIRKFIWTLDAIKGKNSKS